MSSREKRFIEMQVYMDRMQGGRPVLPVFSKFRYDIDDPFAVKIVFSRKHSDKSIEWHLGRDLLQEGVGNLDPNIQVGKGDVVIAALPNPSYVDLHLGRPPERVMFRARRPVLQQFLRSTERRVPPGTEDMGAVIDATVDKILNR